MKLTTDPFLIGPKWGPYFLSKMNKRLLVLVLTSKDQKKRFSISERFGEGIYFVSNKTENSRYPKAKLRVTNSLHNEVFDDRHFYTF